METYLNYLQDVLSNGTPSSDRTGVGTRRVFGRQLRFNLQEGFPLLTTKRVWMKGVARELLWFLRGKTNIRPLIRSGVSIWTDWPLKNYREKTGRDISQEAFEEKIASDKAFANRWGDLGPVYGKQWRGFEGPTQRVDQISRLIEGIQNQPHSRRHVVSAWHPAQIQDMALPPCHFAFQCFVQGTPEEDGRLSLMWQQRSCDSFLGLPFNIASYALLTHMIAQQTGLTPHNLIFSGGDCHLYENHISQAKEQLSRSPYDPPSLVLDHSPTLSAYTLEDIEVVGYNHHPPIEAPIAV